jgi:predicted restriction endonuclease
MHKACLNCSEEFEAEKNKQKFCSRQCYDEYKQNHPDFKESNYTSTARQVVFRVFPRKCMICGWDVIVNVHHIKPRRDGGANDLDNLVILCPNHHAMADRGLISDDELTQIVRAAIAQLPGHQSRSGLQQSDEP